MGSPGQTSAQITFKVNPKLRGKIDEERKMAGGTLAEFINDAVKFYINYLEDKRLTEWKMANEVSSTQTSDRSDPPESDCGEKARTL